MHFRDEAENFRAFLKIASTSGLSQNAFMREKGRVGVCAMQEKAGQEMFSRPQPDRRVRAQVRGLHPNVSHSSTITYQ
jgi:hypothetical protein